MMDEFTKAVVLEIPKLVGSGILLLLAWLIGQRLTVFWNLRQKKKENDLATARDFHSLYGEFFAIWKQWNIYLKTSENESLPETARWNLLERSCIAEGRLESILVRLASEKRLKSSDHEMLGHFRQLYQRLRERMRSNAPLEWHYSEHPDYIAFKTFAPQISALIIGAPISPDISSKSLIEITSNRHER